MESLPNVSTNGFCEIRWHGRGGQGAISSARILADAAFRKGFRGVTSAPSFGAERRGAPVTASTRLSAEPIRIFSQIETPDIVVVLDETLIESGDALSGLKPDGLIIVNSPKEPRELGLPETLRVATADATGTAEEVGLIVGGAPMVNTAMLGAIAKATGLVSLENVKAALDEAFPKPKSQRNFDAALLTYERTKL